MKIQDKLYEKLSKEYKGFIEDLKQKPPDKILEKSYEKVFKEDLLTLFEDGSIKASEAKALIKLDRPLEALYQEWMDTDVSYMDMLKDCVDNMLDKLEKIETRDKPNRKPTLEEKLSAAKEKVKEQDTQGDNNIKNKKHEERN